MAGLTLEQLQSMGARKGGMTADDIVKAGGLPYTSNALTPDQSAGLLGHSTNYISTTLSTLGGIAGGIGGAALGAIGGAELGPGAVGTGYVGGVAGAGVGAGLGEAAGEWIESKLGMRPEGVSPSQVIESGVYGAGGEAVLGPLGTVGGRLLSKVAERPLMKSIAGGLSKVGEMFGGKSAVEYVEKKPLNIATKRIASSAETMTKGERELAVKEGRMTPIGTYKPSATETRAGEIMKGKTYSNPVKTLKSIQDEISTRGAEAEKYLEQSGTRVTNKEDYQAFNAVKNSSKKYMTPAEATAYEEQIGVFQRILKDYVKGDGYSTSNYYKALKDYESQVTANIPKGREALLAPGGSARLQAAKDVRTVVRNMIGSKNPEFKPKMFDLASLYDAVDNVAAKAETGGAKWTTRHPIATGATKYGLGILGAEQIKKELGF